MIRVYLDTCCFSRPLDNQEQLRVRRESEAILDILENAARGDWTIIDDGLIRRARRLQHDVGVRVANPLTWLKERPNDRH